MQFSLVVNAGIQQIIAAPCTSRCQCLVYIGVPYVTSVNLLPHVPKPTPIVTTVSLSLSLQVAAAQQSLGAHSALRHPDLALFWWQHLGGAEEVPWTTLWPHLCNYLAAANNGLLSDKVGDAANVLGMLAQPENLKHLQNATHR